MDLADINRQYSELVLASQSTEKKKRKEMQEKREDNEQDEDDDDKDKDKDKDDLDTRRMVRKKATRESSPGGIIGLVSETVSKTVSFLSPFKPPSPPLTRLRHAHGKRHAKVTGESVAKVHVHIKAGSRREATTSRSKRAISSISSGRNRYSKAQRVGSRKGRTSRPSDNAVDSLLSSSASHVVADASPTHMLIRSSEEKSREAEAKSQSRGVMQSVTKFVSDFLFESD